MQPPRILFVLCTKFPGVAAKAHNSLDSESQASSIVLINFVPQLAVLREVLLLLASNAGITPEYDQERSQDVYKGPEREFTVEDGISEYMKRSEQNAVSAKQSTNSSQASNFF